MKQIFRNKKNLFNHKSLKNVNLPNSKNCYIKDSAHEKNKTYDKMVPDEISNLSEDTKAIKKPDIPELEMKSGDIL